MKPCENKLDSYVDGDVYNVSLLAFLVFFFMQACGYGVSDVGIALVSRALHGKLGV